MLFGPFEKQLDLPSCFVQRRYRRGGEFEVIGHKHVVSGTEPIAVAHASEHDRTAFGGEKTAVNLPIDGQPVHLTLGYLPEGGASQDWVFIPIGIIARRLRKPEFVRPTDGSAFIRDTLSITCFWALLPVLVTFICVPLVALRRKP